MSTIYRMPAEWESHQAIALSWPHNPRTWPGKVEAVRDAYVNFIREILESEEVWLMISHPQMQDDVIRRLRLGRVNDSRLKFFNHHTNDSWIRDYGPICVYDDQKNLCVSDWIFNGWGDKYNQWENYSADNNIPHFLARHLSAKHLPQDLILEGGSIDVNGKGTLITSESCLLNENRNHLHTKTHITQKLNEVLGARHILWVPEGIVGDDTDGHIDDTVRFVNETTLVCAFEPNTNDENHEPLKKAYHALNQQFDQDGRPLTVVKLPMPSPLIHEGERLPASYANFLICNEKVLVPIFKCKEDVYALGILQDLFPGRKVIGIDARDLVIGYGSLHCLSQQIPV